MPVLDKMVSTSDEEQQRQEREERISSVPVLESLFPSENVLLASQLSSETTQIAENLPTQSAKNYRNSRLSDSDDMASSESDHENVSSLKHKKRIKRRSKTNTADDSIETTRKSNVSPPSPDVTSFKSTHQNTVQSRVPKRYASDSDDITSITAYRKKPKKKKKRKKLINAESNANASATTPAPVNIQQLSTNSASSSSVVVNTEINQESSVTTGDAQTQTIPTSEAPEDAGPSSISVRQDLQDEEGDGDGEDAEDETLIISKHEKLFDFERNEPFDSDYGTGSFSDEVVCEGEFQSNLYLPALGSPEEDDAIDRFSFETNVPNPLYRHEPELIKLSPSNDSETANDAMVPLLLDHEPNEMEMAVDLYDGNHDLPDNEHDEFITEVIESTGLEYTFDVSENIANARRLNEPNNPIIPDPILRRALQIHHSDDSEEEHRDCDELGRPLPQNMSTYELMSNPNTLTASLGLIQQLKNTAEPAALRQQLDKELMPPPVLRRPSSPDICSLNPEARMKRPKLKKQTQNKRPDSPQPGPSRPRFQVVDPLLREFLSRVEPTDGHEEVSDQYEPRGMRRNMFKFRM
jgi:hypothetical protein